MPRYTPDLDTCGRCGKARAYHGKYSLNPCAGFIATGDYKPEPREQRYKPGRVPGKKIDIEGTLRRQIAQLEGIAISAAVALEDNARTWEILSETSWIQAPEFASLKNVTVMQRDHLRDIALRTRARTIKVIMNETNETAPGV